jgi:hypothetical protein
MPSLIALSTLFFLIICNLMEMLFKVLITLKD